MSRRTQENSIYLSALVTSLLMNLFRYAGLLIVVLLSACDAQQPPVSKPKTEAAAEAPKPEAAPAPPAVRSTAQAPSESVVSPTVETKPAPVHEMAPGVPVVPVVAGKQPVDKDSAVGPGSARTSKPVADRTVAQTKAAARRDAAADTRKAKKAQKDTQAKNVRLAPAKLDLSLPPELVKELDPPPKVISARRKPILPPMFNTSDSPSDPGPFELNGRLLNNQMELQMRNDSRRDVEGAALDFKFKQ